MADVTELLSRSETRGRLTLTAVTLGSGIAILDGSIVNVALRTIGTELDASLEQLQWVINGYMLALASLVLVGGALGDRLGRRRVYLVGMGWFLVASALCAVAQTPAQLIAMRVLQGVGAALLTPGGLAIIQSVFRREDRAAAIGTWAGLSGIAAAIGPFVGGWLVDNGSWRWIFGINVPLCLAVIALTLWATPESRDTEATERGFDWLGAGLTVVALGALTYALTASSGTSRLVVAGVALVALVAGVGFVLAERRSRHPLVRLSLFGDRVFSAANAMTFVVYGALGVVFFILVLQLQVSAGWSALSAGLTGLPATVALMLLSSRASQLSERIGPRIPMAVGPLICAAGVLLLLPAGEGATWWTVLPGLVAFALGLALLVSPLTSTVLAAAPDRYAGVASGVNNAVARAGSLLAVAALPALVGLSGDDYQDPAAMTAGFRGSMIICAILLIVGGVVSWFGLAGASPTPQDSSRPELTQSSPPASPDASDGRS